MPRQHNQSATRPMDPVMHRKNDPLGDKPDRLLAIVDRPIVDRPIVERPIVD